ncbi:MAG: Fe-S cluster assembly protein SufD [Oscillochloridaceae bacterium umkhey_bin13]
MSLTLKDLTAATLAERAQAAHEPSWLIERRVAAWEYFAQAGPPEWRRTDLSGIDPASLDLTATAALTLEIDPALTALGVVAKPLREALQSHGAVIEAHLDSAVVPLEHKFSALRAALWQDGAFIHVPRNVAAELPIRVRYTMPEGGRTTFPRTLLIADEGSSVTLIEEFTSADQAAPALVGAISEVFAGPGSSVRFISIQRWGAEVYHIAGQKAVLEREANLEWTSIALGAQVQHVESETALKGNGSRVNWLGATFANHKQLLLNAPWLRHVGYHCESFMQFKTVVNDSGYSVFDGMIKIEHESQATSTRLEEHALHLNPGSRNDSIPGLKIDTNSVLKGGHASTSGDVDEEQLFYMQARGISKDEAKRMIVMGFFSPALATIPVEALREELEGIIEGKI